MTPKQELFCLERKKNDFYVYALIDPRNGEPFYIGKGRGRRIEVHEREARLGRTGCNPLKALTIQCIWSEGLTVQTKKIAEGLSEQDAFALERKLIDEMDGLSNIQGGTVSRRERDISWAQSLLKRLKYFEVWVHEHPDNRQYTPMFWMVHDILHQVAAGVPIENATFNENQNYARRYQTA